MTFDASQLDERLQAVADRYRETVVREPGELPPDGDYQAKVESFDFFESKAGELFIKTVLSIVAGGGDEWQGCEATTLHSMEAEQRLPFLKMHLRTLGIEDPDELLGLRARLAKVVGVFVEIRIKTSASTDADGNPYRNVYVNKRLGGESDLPVDTSDFAPGLVNRYADDDIPF